MRLRPSVVGALAVLAVLGCERRRAPAPPQAASAPAAPSQPATGPLLIGYVGALTGPEAHFGLESQNGAQLAVEEANAAGGVQGRTLALAALTPQARAVVMVAGLHNMLPIYGTVDDAAAGKKS